LQKRQNYDFNDWFKNSEDDHIFVQEVTPKWIESLGGMNNAKLRKWLSNFKLA